MIVLSSAVEFDTGQEMRPHSLRQFRRRPDCFTSDTSRCRRFRLEAGPGRMAVCLLARRFVLPVDQLAPLLKPLDPRLFEVRTPEQFRKALAAILGEIAKM